MRAATPAIGLIAALSAGPSARAQDLYADRGVRLEPITPAGAGGTPLGVDGNGWVYAGTSGVESGSPVSCFRPDDPEGTRLRPTAERMRWFVAMAYDRSGVSALGVSGPRPGLARFRCGDGEEGFVWEELDEVEVVWPDGMTAPGYGNSPTLVMGPDDAWCLSTAEGLWCGRLEGVTLTFSLRLALADLDRLVAPDPALWADAFHIGPVEPPESQWRLKGPTWLPDGRLVAIADVRFLAAEATPWLAHVIAADEGAAEVLLRPSWTGEALPDGAPRFPIQPLSTASSVVYEPTLDALLVWPIVGFEFPVAASRGGAGIGLLVLPFGEPRAGYASATAATYRARCGGAVGSGLAVHLPDGGVAVELGGLYRLTLDPDELDLDGDGLSWTEESLLGCSDLTAFSDGGPVRDSIEVRVAGTDPSDPSDDPAPPGSGHVVYAQSGLVVRLLEELMPERGELAFVEGGGASGPLCVAATGSEGACYLDLSAPVPMPVGEDGGLVLSADGSHAVILTEEGYVRVFHEDGGRELAVPLDELAPPEAWSDRTALQVYPIDPGLLFVSMHDDRSEGDRAWDELRLVAFEAGQPGRVVYDHQQAGCDSELGPCDPSGASGGAWGGAHDLAYLGVAPVGWVFELGRFLIAASTTRDRYYVAVPLEGPPEVLAHGHELAGGPRLAGLPGYLVPSGHGDYLTNAGVFDGWLRAGAGATIEGLTGVTKPAAAWGDVIVQKAYVAATPPAGHGQTHSQARYYELVRFEGWADPGDLLVLTREGPVQGGFADHMLRRAGVRGGLADAWPEPALMRDPWGIHAGPDGTLCIAERGARRILLQRQVLPGTPYATVAAYEDVGDVTDCHLGEDGALHALVAAPPAILRVTPGGSEVVSSLASGSRPIDLIETPDGGLEALDANGPSRGYAWLADGRRLEMFKSDFEVAADGSTVARLADLINVVWGQSVSPSAETHVHLMPRPDGLVVAVPFGRLQPQSAVTGRPWVFDPGSGSTYLLSGRIFDPERGVGVAMLPSGAAGDPWGVPEDPPVGDEPTGPDPPAAPEAPTLGIPQWEEKGGCAAVGPGGSSGPSPWLLALVSAAAAARSSRRRRRARRPPRRPPAA